MFFTINLAQDSSKLSPYISNTLLDEIENTLKKGEKVLLYLNKRGAFSSLICEDCQHLFECPNCDVSLTVHNNPEHLLCHICHHAFRIPAACPECGGVKLKSVGIGTQELENIIKKYFKNYTFIPKYSHINTTSHHIFLNSPDTPHSGILSPLEEREAAMSIRKYELKSPGYVFELAKSFRKNPTKLEEQVWSSIKGNKVRNLKFRRQHPIGRYIADFYNEENHLVLELDGKVHKVKYQKEYDEERNILLEQHGFQILRINNEKLENKTDGEIRVFLEQKIVALLSSKGEEIQRGGSAVGKLNGKQTTKKKSIYTYRFDSDSMKNISSKKSALAQLEKADIIIGTKMITTGFDFDKIGLIAVILTESELGYPSYDAQERAYSNLRQLIGRGNRKSQTTKILLQSFIPKNPLVSSLTEKNYKDFLTESLSERKEFHYPPFTQMVTLEYRHKDKSESLAYMEKLEETLKNFDSEKKYIFLRGTNSFRKNNTHHTSMIIKGDNIRELLKNIKHIILKERNLSVIFS